MKKPLITPTDRLSLTICCAIILHGILVLGLTFVPEDNLPSRFEPMEIVLVQDASQLIEEAQAIAQFTAQGSGETVEDEEFTANVPVVLPPQEDTVPTPQIAETQAIADVAEIAPTADVVEDSPTAELSQVALNRESIPGTSEVVPEVLAVADAVVDEVVEMETTDPVVEEGEIEPSGIENIPKTPELPKHSTVAVLANIAEMAALSARLDERLKQKKQRIRKKFISASTKENKYALYMKLWTSKVEHVGNLNYPEIAKEKKLSGKLRLDVALNSDGSVASTRIMVSSGYPVLDEAAIRIVNLAAPYPPFSDDIREETDVLHIIRTWKFSDTHQFR